MLLCLLYQNKAAQYHEVLYDEALSGVFRCLVAAVHRTYDLSGAHRCLYSHYTKIDSLGILAGSLKVFHSFQSD